MSVRSAVRASPTDDVALRATNVRKHYSAKRKPAIPALAGVSVDVRRGEIVGLVGPDGAGKTTLLRCMAGLLVPDDGSIDVLGLDSVKDTIAIRSRIGYMPQKFGLYQDLTVRENLDLYADLQSVTPGRRKERYDRLMRMTGLASFTRRLAGRLSGGMKQKLGLACALVKSPELLLLDEPTVGVDPVSRRELWAIIDELVADENLGVLVSTAYLDEAEHCVRVVVLDQGEVIAVDTPAAFRAPLDGQVVQIACASQRQARHVQATLTSQAGVADATIRSGRVRVVFAEGATPPIADVLPTELRGEIERAAPAFEDAFMRMVHERRQAPADGRPRAESGARSASAPASGEVVVRVRNLTRRFGDFEAVKDISFDVADGEVFGLLGPNGAGKSTTFRMLCGLLTVTRGDVRVAGRDLRRAGGKARARLGYMAQQFSLYGMLNVEENLRFFGQAYGLSPRKLRERIDWAYEEFALHRRRHDAAGSLPGGYKQRLAMAAAMLHEPDILFLDEPTSGVDPLARREFWRRITAFAEAGVTVIVTTHFMEEAEYCDRMLIMVQGAALALGSPQEIRALAQDDEHPDPSIEDAFIALAEGRVQPVNLRPGERGSA